MRSLTLVLLPALLCLSPVALGGEAGERYRIRLAKALGLADEEWRNDPDHVWAERSRRARNLLAAGRHAEVDAMLDGFTAGTKWSARDGEGVSSVYEDLARTRYARYLDAWAARAPKSPHPHVVRSRGLLNTAWAARGRGFSNTVTEEGWKTWARLIPQAQASLEKAIALRPDLAMALVDRLAIDRAAQTPRKLFEEHFSAAKAAAPGNYRLYSEALWFNLPRYYGTWALAWGMVEALQRDHPGHPTTVSITFRAHSFFASERHDGDDQAYLAYFRQPRVRKNLSEVFSRARKADPSSRIPSLIELRMTKPWSFPESRVQLFGQELAEKGDPYWLWKRGTELLATSPLSSADRKLGRRYLFLSFLKGEAKAKDALWSRFISSRQLSSKDAEVAYNLCRLVSGEDFWNWSGREIARYHAISMHRRGVGVRANPKAAVAELLREARAGNQHCAFDYALLLRSGESGVTPNRGSSDWWLAKAAAKGQADAIDVLLEDLLKKAAVPTPERLKEFLAWIRVNEGLKSPAGPGLRRKLARVQARSRAEQPRLLFETWSERFLAGQKVAHSNVRLFKTREGFTRKSLEWLPSASGPGGLHVTTAFTDPKGMVLRLSRLENRVGLGRSKIEFAQKGKVGTWTCVHRSQPKRSGQIQGQVQDRVVALYLLAKSKRTGQVEIREPNLPFGFRRSVFQISRDKGRLILRNPSAVLVINAKGELISEQQLGVSGGQTAATKDEAEARDRSRRPAPAPNSTKSPGLVSIPGASARSPGLGWLLTGPPEQALAQAPNSLGAINLTHDNQVKLIVQVSAIPLPDQTERLGRSIAWMQKNLARGTPSLVFSGGKLTTAWGRPALEYKVKGVLSQQVVDGRVWVLKHGGGRALVIFLLSPGDFVERCAPLAEAAHKALTLEAIQPSKPKAAPLPGGLSLQVPSDWKASKLQGGAGAWTSPDGSSCTAWPQRAAPTDTQASLLKVWVQETQPRLGGAAPEPTKSVQLGGRPFLLTEFLATRDKLPIRISLYVGQPAKGRCLFLMAQDSGREPKGRLKEVLSSARWKKQGSD